MDLKECYAAMEADYDDVLCRLASEERVKKFLLKLADDKSFTEIREGLLEQDYEKAFRASHTLKGVCMNLGLTVLQKSSGALTENLRGLKPDEDTQRLFDRLEADYRAMAASVNKLKDSGSPEAG